MQPRTCCPEGKLYDPVQDKCYNLNHLEPTDPIECPCCPKGYAWNDSLAACADLTGNTIEPLDPCPCCPEGYLYFSISGLCQRISGSDALEPSPAYCLSCNCETIEPTACAACGSKGLPNNFHFEFNKKQCNDCTPEDLQMTKNGCLNVFLPIQYISPVINFKLNNNNLL